MTHPEVQLIADLGALLVRLGVAEAVAQFVEPLLMGSGGVRSGMGHGDLRGAVKGQPVGDRKKA
jgi:hypothetical protein